MVPCKVLKKCKLYPLGGATSISQNLNPCTSQKGEVSGEAEGRGTEQEINYFAFPVDKGYIYMVVKC